MSAVLLPLSPNGLRWSDAETKFSVWAAANYPKQLRYTVALDYRVRDDAFDLKVTSDDAAFLTLVKLTWEVA